MGFDFTPSQSRAISSRGRSVLVSAAAGSGKTRVLTERLMSFVTDGAGPRDIDSFLVITYTRAAAAELRARIIDELGARIAENPLDANLRRQQNLCYHARIGTIHSFCTEVIRENCHHIGVSPAFKVMDEDRADAIKAAVSERVLESRYESIGGDPDFALLVDTVGAGRDDSRLVSILLSLHTKMRSHAYPEDWVARQLAAYDFPEGLDAGETPWGRELLESVRAEAGYHAHALEAAAREIYARGDKITAAYYQNFADDAAAARELLRALDGGWDHAARFVPDAFSRLGALRGYEDTEFAERVKGVREAYKKAMKSLRDVFAQTSRELIADMRKTAPAARALLGLVMDFDRAFSAEKRRRGLLDFSDLEHCALSLLVDKATGKPTWIAFELSRRFTEIMVDEYQDVNAVQDMIFRAVSREGANLFMVGDVKQSIYRFRLADPTIFLGKYELYSRTGEGEKILLRENFRSRKSVLDAANSVFGAIMSRELGELDYGDEAALRFGARGYPEGGDTRPELRVLDASSGDGDDTMEKAELEARYVARRISEMVAGRVQVYSGGVGRDCDYGDFVILLRSPSGRGAVFRRVLAQSGIPVASQLAGGFFSSPEVTMTINLLSVIDNPHADVPLIAVLRSPLFSFTPDELSEIRVADKDADFFTALCRAAERGNARCAEFVGFLAPLRRLSADLSLDALIWRIYGETDIFALCSAMPDGDARRTNLMHLFEYAARFEESGCRGVFSFVRRLRRAAARGEEPDVPAGGGRAVGIMSIHRSKGLEFPFVFLCGLAHMFNLQDLRENVLVHSELGLGLKVTDAARGIEYPTLARRAIERRLKNEALSEEMRVLYVAMTRARERLIMTAALPNAEETLKRYSTGVTAPIAPALLASASAPVKWLAMACAADGGRTVDLEVVSASPSRADTGEDVRPAGAEPGFGREYEEIKSRLDFAYPYAGAVSLPSKVTATELKGLLGEKEARGEAAGLVTQKLERRFRRPDFTARGTLSAAERGTATHTLLQHIRLDSTGTPGLIAGEVSRLVAEGRLTEAEGRAIDTRAVREFFASPLGRDMLAADELRREFRFTLLADAGEHLGAPEGDKLLLQGVIDCWFVKDGEVTVVDYKTDRVCADGVPARAQSYANQLRAYAGAIRRITGLPVKRCLLYFLVPGRTYEPEL